MVCGAFALAGICEQREGMAFAGEVRFHYSELALLVRTQMQGRSLVVACGGVAGLPGRCAGGGSVTLWLARGEDLADSMAMFSFEAPGFSALGGRYQFRPATPFSLTIDVRARVHGLDLMVASPEDVQLVLACVSGACTSEVLLPRLVWRAPALSVHIGSPARGLGRGTNPALIAGDGAAAGDGRALEIQDISLSGRFDVVCPQGWGFAPIVCMAVRAAIGDDFSALMRMASRAMRVKANALGLSVLVASALGAADGKAARDGVWGALRIATMESDAGGVRISFCLWPECR